MYSVEAFCFALDLQLLKFISIFGLVFCVHVLNIQQRNDQVFKEANIICVLKLISFRLEIIILYGNRSLSRFSVDFSQSSNK